MQNLFLRASHTGGWDCASRWAALLSRVSALLLWTRKFAAPLSWRGCSMLGS